MAQMQFSSCRDAPVTTVNNRDQRSRDQIVFEQAKTDMLLAAVNGSVAAVSMSRHMRTSTPTQAHNLLMNLGIAELGWEPERKDGLKTEKQLLKAGIVSP